jgi:hypothetical protein
LILGTRLMGAFAVRAMIVEKVARFKAADGRVVS